MKALARLLADGGVAAVSEEFFRSRAFYDAEKVTHSVVIEGDEAGLALPALVRPIPGEELVDAISPYGYPGAEVSGRPIEAGEVDWAETGLVSLFVRDRVGEPRAFAVGTERSLVLLSDPELARKSRMSDRQQVRKNAACGYTVRSSAGPEVAEEDRSTFEALYTATMERTGAAQRYFFGSEYFQSVLSCSRTWLFLCDGPEGDGAAGAIAALSDGFLHYYLSGTADAHLRNAPSKNLIESVISFAEELGAPVNLGGGVRPGDGLEEFKRGFANRQLPFVTHEIVCDPAHYERLCAGREDTGFFPLYRAG